MNKEELLHLASRLAESASSTTISKVEQAAKAAWKKFNDADMWRKEFLEMLILYCKQKDILGGGNAAKADFENFVTNVLNIKKSKDSVIIWNHKELSELVPEQVFFVLGWARRLAGKQVSPNKPSAFVPEGIMQPVSDTSSGKDEKKSTGKKDKGLQRYEKTDDRNMTDDMFSMLAKYYNSKRLK